MKPQQIHPIMLKFSAITTHLTLGEATMKKINLTQLRDIALSALMLGGAYILTNILGAHDAFATSVADLITNVNTNVVAKAPPLIYGAAYVGGTTALMMGAFKLKAHAENPGQTPMQQGLARLGVGGALIALPSMGNAITTSMDNNSATTLQGQGNNFSIQ